MNLKKIDFNNSVCEEINFNSLFKKHSKLLFNFLVFKYGDKQMAEDAVQESFLTLWKNCNEVTFEKAKSYVFTIAKNKIIDSFRKKNTAQKHLNNQDASLYEKETPIFILEEKEFHVTLNKVLSKMPEKYRVPFLLNRIEKKNIKKLLKY